MRESGDSLRFRAILLAGVALACCFALGCAREKVHFVLEPSVVSACRQPVATQVSWDVSALGLKYATVEVNNLGRPPKPWVSGGKVETFRAGAWAYDGYTVTLKSLNGVVLARRTLTTAPCPGMSWL